MSVLLKPTRLTTRRVRNAAHDAYDFMTTNLDAGGFYTYKETLEVLRKVADGERILKPFENCHNKSLSESKVGKSDE